MLQQFAMRQIHLKGQDQDRVHCRGQAVEPAAGPAVTAAPAAVPNPLEAEAERDPWKPKAVSPRDSFGFDQPKNLKTATGSAASRGTGWDGSAAVTECPT